MYPLAYDKDTKMKLYDFTLLATAGRRQHDTSAIVDRYDHRILATWLADFIVLGTGGSAGRGSFAQSKNKTDLFSLAAESFLDLIVNEFNTKAIPDLLSLNQMKGACRMRHGDISEGNILEFGTAVSNLATSLMITPDPNTEEAVRAKIGLPPRVGTGADNLASGGDAEGGGDNDPAGDEDQAGAAQGQGETDQSSDDAPPPGTVQQRTLKGNRKFTRQVRKRATKRRKK